MLTCECLDLTFDTTLDNIGSLLSNHIPLVATLYDTNYPCRSNNKSRSLVTPLMLNIDGINRWSCNFNWTDIPFPNSYISIYYVLYIISCLTKHTFLFNVHSVPIKLFSFQWSPLVEAPLNIRPIQRSRYHSTASTLGTSPVRVGNIETTWIRCSTWNWPLLIRFFVFFYKYIYIYFLVFVCVVFLARRHFPEKEDAISKKEVSRT